MVKSIASVDEEKLDLDRHTIACLVPYLAETNNDMTYGQLAEAVGKRRGQKMDPRGFAGVLGRIQVYCNELSLPCLSAMVIATNKNGSRKGFINYYRELHPELADLPEDKVRAKERKEVFACNEWQKLYDYVGLAETAPEMEDKYPQHKAEEAYEEGLPRIKAAHIEATRSPEIHAKCLRIKGSTCIVCGFNSEELYGIKNIIQVHHLKPVCDGPRQTSIADLVPVCPTCHVMLHSKPKENALDHYPVYTPNELRAIMGKEPLGEY